MAVTATVLSDWTVTLTTDSALPGEWRRVTNTGADVLVGTARTVNDRNPPLGRDVSWTWIDAAGVQQTPDVVVDSTHPVLSSALGALSVQIVVMRQRPLSWEGRTVVHRVIGRASGLAAVQPAAAPTGELTLDLPHPRIRTAVLQLLQAGDPLILRAPPCDTVDDVVMVAKRWSDPWAGPAQRFPARLVIEFEAVDPGPTAWTPAPLWTLGDVEDAYDTLGDVEDAFATLGDLETGPPL